MKACNRGFSRLLRLKGMRLINVFNDLTGDCNGDGLNRPLDKLIIVHLISNNFFPPIHNRVDDRYYDQG